MVVGEWTQGPALPLCPRALVQNRCGQVKAVTTQLLPRLQRQEERERKAAVVILTEVGGPLQDHTGTRQAHTPLFLPAPGSSEPTVGAASGCPPLRHPSACSLGAPSLSPAPDNLGSHPQTVKLIGQRLEQSSAVPASQLPAGAWGGHFHKGHQ